MELMDVTLRDGSYAINFQFSCSDVKVICSRLEEIGLQYIEIGHGMGLGASCPQNGISLNTDEEYLAAAQETIKHAKYGMFCIPGTAKLKDLELAGKYHMSFVRIGTNVDEIEKSGPFIEKAKQLGMEVMANYMKSYAITPCEFAQKVLLSEKYGADVVYIVDSAGGMFPEDIKNYYEAIRSVSNIKVGFHAHNNLGLAVYNSLYASELGVDFIDCSLQGLGRSAGNASTELVMACLQKKKHLSYQYKEAVMLGKELIQPLLKRHGVNPLDLTCGFADFHTSYMQSIHRTCAKWSVNPLDLIEAYTAVDKVNMDEERLEEIAIGLQREKIYLSNYGFSDYFGNEQMN